MTFGSRPRSRPEGVMEQAALQEREPMSRLGWFLSVLAVVIPAGSVYVWRSGVLSGTPEPAPVYTPAGQAAPGGQNTAGQR